MTYEEYVDEVKIWLLDVGYMSDEVSKYVEWSRTTMYENYLAGLSAEFTARNLS